MNTDFYEGTVVYDHEEKRVKIKFIIGETTYIKAFDSRDSSDGSGRQLVLGETVLLNVSQHDAGVVKIDSFKRAHQRFLAAVINAASGGVATVESAEFPSDLKSLEIKTKDVVKDPRKSHNRAFLDEGEFVDLTIKDYENPSGTEITLADPGTFLERFSIVTKFDEKISALAKLAQPEPWKHRDDKTKQENPVLINYIKYTFSRLYIEKKILYGNTRKNEEVAVWNTGLVSEGLEDIYGLHYRANEQKEYGPKWFFADFIRQSDPRATACDVPELASYFTDYSDIFFDPSRRIEIDTQHIIKDRINRFPAVLRDQPNLISQMLENQKNDISRRIRRNYKTAVPQYHRGRIQLLVPISFSEETLRAKIADAALMLVKHDKAYTAKTILELPHAYNNARLLTKPDSEWL